MVKIAFFEIEGWEKPYLEKELKEHELFFEGDILTRHYDLSKIKGVDIVSTFIYSRVDKEVINQLPNLKAVITRSTGFDHIDTEECKNRGIAVFNVPAYGITTVAEYTILLILSLLRRIKIVEEVIKRPHYLPKDVRGYELNGKVLGVIGTGRIGSHVVKLAHAFGAKIIAYDIIKRKELEEKYGVKYVDLDTLLSTADIITIHVPYTPQTHHMINRENITKVKKGALIVNTARGGIIEIDALIEALEEGRIAGAALDVVEGEWVLRGEIDVYGKSKTASQKELRDGVLVHLLKKYPNVIVTPHIAYNTWEALHRILEVTVNTIRGFLKGEELNNRIV